MPEQYIDPVREDDAWSEDMGGARAMGLEGGGEGLLEAGADEDAVSSADTDEPGYHLVRQASQPHPNGHDGAPVDNTTVLPFTVTLPLS